jgi:hydroxyethylthiazole kinase-like uncharacterized protein yjeF
MQKYSPDVECPVMTRDQVRAFDRHAISELGIPGVVLMENAGRSCAELVIEKLEDLADPKVCIFCGTGNNGGDGYVIARHLLNRRFGVNVVICGDRGKVKGDAATNLEILEHLGQAVHTLDPHTDDISARVIELAAGSHMLVDALFGTGLTGPLGREYMDLIGAINAQTLPILAVDIPSGLDCDTGRPLGAAVRAACTVTFVAAKQGFTTPSSAEYTGEIFVASIGVEPGLFP